MLKVLPYAGDHEFNISIATAGKKNSKLIKVSDIPEFLRLDKWSADGYVLGVDKGTEFSIIVKSTGADAFAVVPSIKGVNPLTGLKGDANIYQYGRGVPCPMGHGPLGKGGFCEECDHTWPTNNYVSTLHGDQHISGWRTSKDEERPFLISEDPADDVASFINKGDVVDALGFAVYRAKGLGFNSTLFGHHFPSGPTPRIWHGVDVPIQNYHYSSAGPDASGSTFTASIASVSSEQLSVAGGEVRSKADSTTHLDANVLPDKPERVILIHPISYEVVQDIINAVNREVRSGPFKGMPSK